MTEATTTTVTRKSRVETLSTPTTAGILFHATGRGRDVTFEGLMIGGGSDGWLVPVGHLSERGLVNNFKANLIRLPADRISRRWLSELVQGVSEGPHAPETWTEWVATGANGG